MEAKRQRSITIRTRVTLAVVGAAILFGIAQGAGLALFSSLDMLGFGG